MARESPEARQSKRARQDLAVALERKDAERAVNALLLLPQQERDADLIPVARLFHSAVARDHRAGDRARLDFWSARAERDRRLLLGETGLADPQTAWALLWSCARSKQWGRARHHAASIAERLPERLRIAIDTFLAAEGAPAPELYRDLLPAPEPSDPRLGYDRGQRSALTAAPVQAPTTPDDVQPAVLALSALSPVGHFTSTVERWAAASPEMAPALLALSARLLRGEILSRMSRGASPLEPAQALAGFLQRLNHPAALEAEAALALRVARGLARDRPSGLDRHDALGLCAIIRAAVAFPALRPGALALVLDAPFGTEARTAGLELLEELCRLPDTSRLQLKALVLWSRDSSPDSEPPRWISVGMSELLRKPGGLATELAGLPERTRQAVLLLAPQVLPLEDAERFWDQAWDSADDATKPMLLEGFDEIVSRARERSGTGLPSSLTPSMIADLAEDLGFDAGTEGLGELRQLLATARGRRAIRQFERELAEADGEPLPRAARQFWDRFADRVIPYRISYLETALEQGGAKPEKMRMVKCYLGDRADDPETALQAIRAAERGGCQLAFKALLDYLLVRLADDRDGLAFALLYAGRHRIRRMVRNRLARLFEAADDRARASGRPDSLNVLSARLELRMLGGRGRSKPAKTSVGKRKRRTRARSPGEQILIPFGENEG